MRDVAAVFLTLIVLAGCESGEAEETATRRPPAATFAHPPTRPPRATATAEPSATATNSAPIVPEARVPAFAAGMQLASVSRVIDGDGDGIGCES